MSVPSAASRTFQGVTATIRISGATMTTVGDWRYGWGFRVLEEAVVGSTTPYLGTGVFHGEIEGSVIGASDHRWEQLVTPTSGILTTFGMTLIESDQQATQSTRTWTFSGKFTEYEKVLERDNFIRFRTRAILATEPTVV